MDPKTRHNRFLRILALPIRALTKARDLYVNTMNGAASRGSCYGGGYMAAEPLPRSFSTTSVRSSFSDDNASDDLRELIRASSSSRLYGNKIDVITPNNNRSHRKPPLPPKHRGVPRSASVGMAKIEEEKPSEFQDDHKINPINGNNDRGKKTATNSLFARSRSYAV